MYFKKHWLYILLILFNLVLASCTSGQADQEVHDEGQVKIYTTVYPLKDFTEKIGSPYVNVQSIYPPNVDEHTFEPSQKDMLKIVDADLFFHIGFGLEGFVNKTKAIMEEEGVKVIAIGEEINPESSLMDFDKNDNEHDDANHEHRLIDPHIWIDPIYAKQMAEQITVHLSEILPEHKDHFQKNMTELEKQFDDLHEQFHSVTSQAKHDTIIVSHAAFNYWEKRYGIKQISIAGLSTAQEPSQKQLQNLIDTVKAEKIKYILVEQNVSNRLVDVVTNEANLEPLPIHNLATLTSDDIEKNNDYFSLMKANLKTLEKALNE